MSTQKNTATVTMESFPFYLDLEIWAVADNQLGTVESEHLRQEATSFGKALNNYGQHSSALAL